MPQKRQAHFIRACRLIFINITLSNRIVKPNNRYTRQPASHDFLFYSAPDKVYVLTATNRIAMRFAVRSVPPLSYHADSSTVPKAEFEVAHCQRRNLKRHIATRRFAIARNAPTIPKAEFGAAHSRSRNLKRHIAAKTAGTFYPCLPSYFYQYHAVKPHCKAK